MNRALCQILAVGVLIATATTRAEVYELPPEGFDVIGAVSTVTARYEDTLVDIARRHGLGYEDIVRANPGVNIWVPGEGTEVVLPTQFILPPGPRNGIVLNLAEYRMYYFPEPKDGETAYVMTYPISIGRMDWETPLGNTSVISKVRNPSWYVPQSVLAEHAAEGRPLPRIVPPGPDNPLGKYAMRLGLPGYLIHGTNRPAGVGMRVTHGCIRMFPEDIEYLFPRIGMNTSVRIINEPVKMGWIGSELVMEVHPVLETAALRPEEVTIEQSAGELAVTVPEIKDPLSYVTEQFIATTAEKAGQLDWELAEQLIERSDGIPAPVGEEIKNAAASAAFE
ncbi:MAG: L,D-transpeptidase family protein [Woeseiaceae bacterium]|nr:L,D-transpeptidase family protein [Woeseiaceae bacterium]NIP19632.1 L,D-transpeptidase family protein [Woeseiaceae bacterium]NIS89749.1 L,D-transpeptidase family protein [Woeseiaceae bacterium]